MTRTAKVAVLPNCDICKYMFGITKVAAYDGKTKEGPWANMCISHFKTYGIGLGTGKGQKLELDNA